MKLACLVVAGCCVGKSLKMLVPFVPSMQAELGRVLQTGVWKETLFIIGSNCMPLKVSSHGC